MPQLAPGDKVLIQNQYGAGKAQKKWDKSGLVLQDMGFHKYQVKIDGSGRITDRNRQFLRKFTPVTPRLPGPSPHTGTWRPTNYQPVESETYQPVETSYSESQAPNTPARSHFHQHFDPIPTIPETSLYTPTTPRTEEALNSPNSPSFVTPPSSPVTQHDSPESRGVQPNLPETSTLPETPTLPRRSTRVSRPPDRWGYNKF